MNAEEYEARFGCKPEQDDLERTTCNKAGEVFHYQCGICDACEKPRFLCGHLKRSSSDV